jgi:hypothetical protein
MVSPFINNAALALLNDRFPFFDDRWYGLNRGTLRISKVLISATSGQTNQPLSHTSTKSYEGFFLPSKRQRVHNESVRRKRGHSTCCLTDSRDSLYFHKIMRAPGSTLLSGFLMAALGFLTLMPTLAFAGRRYLATNSTKTDLTFVFNGPMTKNGGWQAGHGQRAFAQLMAHEINQNPNILPDHNLRIVYQDSACQASTAVEQFYQMIAGEMNFWSFYKMICT